MVLLLDEPLTNLDAKLRHDMRAEFKRLHREFGITIVYATPDELEALSMGDEIAVMRDGAVVQRGTPDELYEEPADLYVAGKIGSPTINLAEAEVERDGRRLATPFGALPLATNTATGGEKAVIGIRPSDVRLAQSGEEAIPASVHLVEPLGDVTLVSFAAAGQTLRAVLPEAQAAAMQPGDQVPILIDRSKILVFRASTGLALREPAAA